MKIGEYVRKLRIDKGLTLSEIAGKIGKTVGYLSDFERGNRTAKKTTLSQIAVALGVPASDIHEAARKARISALKQEINELTRGGKTDTRKVGAAASHAPDRRGSDSHEYKERPAAFLGDQREACAAAQVSSHAGDTENGSDARTVNAASNSPRSVSGGGTAAAATSTLVPCGDRCVGCGVQLDDNAVLSIGAAILDLGDMCTPCQREEIRAYAGCD